MACNFDILHGFSSGSQETLSLDQQGLVAQGGVSDLLTQTSLGLGATGGLTGVALVN